MDILKAEAVLCCEAWYLSLALVGRDQVSPSGIAKDDYHKTASLSISLMLGAETVTTKWQVGSGRSEHFGGQEAQIWVPALQSLAEGQGQITESLWTSVSSSKMTVTQREEWLEFTCSCNNY